MERREKTPWVFDYLGCLTPLNLKLRKQFFHLLHTPLSTLHTFFAAIAAGMERIRQSRISAPI